MELIHILRELSRRRRWVVAGVLVAIVVVIGIALRSHSTSQWTASDQMFIDSSKSAIPDVGQALDPLVPRAGIYAEIMISPAVLDLIGQAAGVPADQITATGAADSTGARPVHGATVLSSGGYQIQLADPSPDQPLIAVTAQASTGEKALALANGAALGLTRYLDGLAASENVPTKRRIGVRQLGQPSVGEVTGGSSKFLVLAIFVLFVVGWCGLIILAVRFAEGWRQSAGSVPHGPLPATEPTNGVPSNLSYQERGAPVGNDV